MDGQERREAAAAVSAVESSGRGRTTAPAQAGEAG